MSSFWDLIQKNLSKTLISRLWLVEFLVGLHGDFSGMIYAGGF